MLLCCAFLIMHFVHVSSGTSGCTDTNQEDSLDWQTAISVSLRVVGMVTSIVPMGPLPGAFWIAFDLGFADGNSNNNSSDAREILCFLEKYHADRIATKFDSFSQALKVRRDNHTRLDDLRHQMGQIDVVTAIKSSFRSTQAAIYPMISVWATLHLGVYKQLIYLTPSNNTKVTLSRESDQWLIFYSKLLLRYSRSYKEFCMQQNGREHGEFWRPASHTVVKLQSLAWTQQTKETMLQLANSCKLTPNNRVMFRYKGVGHYWQNGYISPLGEGRVKNWHFEWLDSNKFLSCRGEGNFCLDRICSNPEGWGCSSEMFMIRDARQNEIEHGNTVKIQRTLSIHSYPDFLLTAVPSSFFYGKYLTLNRPRSSPSQKFRLSKWNRMFDGDKVIYDGDIVSFVSGNNLKWMLYEINVLNSECSKVDSVYSPAVH
eukprot:TRINITY_DN454_c0_g1_i10.p1 TRINITY_DN454_c0_g1~~TRINITY_DN454_c0_g1_i10.p1  ORF type:complete len:429 (+),score=12.75 TRINITY_DN454_c0_g1_i10:81-1367(+)